MTEKQRVTCQICHRSYVGRKPKGGTGDFFYPRKHYEGARGGHRYPWQEKKVCQGAFREGV